MKQCIAELKGDSLILATGAASSRFRWNDGHLIGESARNTKHDRAWTFAGNEPSLELPDESAESVSGTFEVIEEPETPIAEAHLRAVATANLGGLEVRRDFLLYPDCPLIRCRIYLRGRATGTWRDEQADAASLSNIESAAAAQEGAPKPTVMHRFFLPSYHVEFECVQFFDITDRRNNLVQTRRAKPYLHPLSLPGNVLFCRDVFEDRSLILVKESPCSDVQLPVGGDDFLCRRNELQITGIGLLPEDLDPEIWTPGYGFAFGASTRDPYEVLRDLRDYQIRQRRHMPERDEMIMLNTWGDRSMDDSMSEEFVMKEIDAGRRLGVTHFQLDHGWETTESAERTTPLNLKGIWNAPRFWDVHPTRFPRGLGPCVDAAKAAGIELCMWFNPSIDYSYEHWHDDANVLIGLYRKYGVRTFKIDGVQLPDKTAENNLRRMLDAVMAETGNEAVFNLDVTAGRRFGYHYFNEYGNKFLENRYTDWSNYYAHWALRNLWMLSRYVPAQSLQIEFLNKWRNPDNYPAGDPLAPHQIPFEYCFAVAMMGQPLAWFEASRLPEEAFEAAGLISTYREHMNAIHAGCILPIGEEPSGAGWTGFQSCGEGEGYLLIFRELNDRPKTEMTVWGMNGRQVRFSAIAGSSLNFEAAIDGTGTVSFELPEPFTFALYRYQSSLSQRSASIP